MTYLTEVAPFNLCNFVIREWRVQHGARLTDRQHGQDQPQRRASPKRCSLQATWSTALSPSLTWNTAERQDFRAVMIYREMDKYGLPQKRSIMLRWSRRVRQDYEGGAFPQEEFDISNFCSSRRTSQADRPIPNEHPAPNRPQHPIPNFTTRPRSGPR